MRTVRTPNILPVHSVNVLDGMSIVYVFHILLGSKNFLIFYPFMYILVAYPEHPHGMRDANIPLYIPGISLGWRVLVGQADIVELCTWGCWPTEPMNKRSLFLSVRYFSVTSQYRLRHLPGSSCSSVSFLRKIDCRAPPLWAFLNLESEKETPSAVKLIDLLSIPASSLAL